MEPRRTLPQQLRFGPEDPFGLERLRPAPKPPEPPAAAQPSQDPGKADLARFAAAQATNPAPWARTLLELAAQTLGPEAPPSVQAARASSVNQPEGPGGALLDFARALDQAGLTEQAERLRRAERPLTTLLELRAEAKRGGDSELEQFLAMAQQITEAASRLDAAMAQRAVRSTPVLPMVTTEGDPISLPAAARLSLYPGGPMGLPVGSLTAADRGYLAAFNPQTHSLCWCAVMHAPAAPKAPR